MSRTSQLTRNGSVGGKRVAAAEGIPYRLPMRAFEAIIVFVSVAVIVVSLISILSSLTCSTQDAAAIATAVATAGLAGAAVYGLVIWRQPIKGQLQMELARSLAKHLDGLGKAVETARSSTESLMPILARVADKLPSTPLPPGGIHKILYEDDAARLKEFHTVLANFLTDARIILGKVVWQELDVLCDDILELSGIFSLSALAMNNDWAKENLPLDKTSLAKRERPKDETPDEYGDSIRGKIESLNDLLQSFV